MPKDVKIEILSVKTRVVSSAKSDSFTCSLVPGRFSPLMLGEFRIFVSTGSKTRMYKSGDRGHTCHTPLCIGKDGDK